MEKEWRSSYKTASTPLRSESKKNIVQQELQTTVPIKVTDLQTMSQLRVAITNTISDDQSWRQEDPSKDMIGELPPEWDQVIDPMLLTVNIAKQSVVIEMEIMGKNLTNTIIDGGSGVNRLPKDT